ncbi:MAG TPA: hypothetical protein VMU26_21620 [Candidatus Polarisedimenticolia bacterium]|nr:hypothetical protein [Candidatus Polarisedimenticolia bacterium]
MAYDLALGQAVDPQVVKNIPAFTASAHRPRGSWRSLHFEWLMTLVRQIQCSGTVSKKYSTLTYWYVTASTVRWNYVEVRFAAAECIQIRSQDLAALRQFEKIAS